MMLKKVLRVLVAIIGLFLLIFAIISLIGPSVTYTNEVIVNKPVTDCWKLLHDDSKTGEWLIGLNKSEKIKDVEGEIGDVYKLTFVEGENTMVIEETVTAFEENKIFAFDMEADILSTDYKMEMREENGKTICTSTSIAKGKGFFFRGMLPLIKSTMKNQDLMSMEKFKELAEKIN